ncbi:MAG TPA: GntR family transcriptional regulator, partial [Alteromonas sp.]|nr:GntR family transcriptional regulator [Alteromonas sp.]HCL13458.1 GntR family transcriptional regulator [Alteromonas sp.]
MSIVVKTLSEQAYEIIRERILANDMFPAKPIRQDALSQDLGVSKIPLREA